MALNSGRLLLITVNHFHNFYWQIMLKLELEISNCCSIFLQWTKMCFSLLTFDFSAIYWDSNLTLTRLNISALIFSNYYHVLPKIPTTFSFLSTLPWWILNLLDRKTECLACLCSSLHPWIRKISTGLQTIWVWAHSSQILSIAFLKNGIKNIWVK